MARRSNLQNLIYDAFNNPGEGGATASNRNWIATRMGNYVGVEHHGTHMFNVNRAGIVEPVDRGHGSMTDRCGVRRITAGFGCGGPQGIGYRELYDDEPMNRLGSDQWRHAIDRSTWSSSGISEPNRLHPTSTAPIGEARRSRIIRGVIGDPVPVGGIRTRRPQPHFRPQSDPVIESAQREGYYGWDMNRQGPDYSQPDPFDFSDPEEARQAQSITDMEETLRGLDERSQRPRNEG
jgi:hypothetical protein